MKTQYIKVLLEDAMAPLTDAEDRITEANFSLAVDTVRARVALMEESERLTESA